MRKVFCYRLAVLASIALIASCSSAPQFYLAEFLALGTTVSIAVIDDSRAHASEAIAKAESQIKQIGHEWYPWSHEGELVALNTALAEGRSQRVSNDLLDVLQRSRDVYRLSDGAFDPAIGGLVKLWGFNVAERPSTDAPPSFEQRQAWRNDHPTLGDLTFNGDVISSTRRDVLIDLGAIGKGYAVDRAIASLRHQGITRALVNAGGNLRAIGSGMNNAWRIAINNPRAAGALYTIDLHDDESVSTSGDDQRFVINGTHRWHHLLDPRTAEPAEHTIAVTVFASDATLADAASTAIFMAGPGAWREVAKKLGVRNVLRIDASGHMQITRSLMPRLIVPPQLKGDTKRDASSFSAEVVDL